jgi:hypothetical protein
MRNPKLHKRDRKRLAMGQEVSPLVQVAIPATSNKACVVTQEQINRTKEEFNKCFRGSSANANRNMD